VWKRGRALCSCYPARNTFVPSHSHTSCPLYSLATHPLLPPQPPLSPPPPPTWRQVPVATSHSPTSFLPAATYTCMFVVCCLGPFFLQVEPIHPSCLPKTSHARKTLPCSRVASRGLCARSVVAGEKQFDAPAGRTAPRAPAGRAATAARPRARARRSACASGAASS
jgi:hypothetical protein